MTRESFQKAKELEETIEHIDKELKQWSQTVSMHMLNRDYPHVPKPVFDHFRQECIEALQGQRARAQKEFEELV